MSHLAPMQDQGRGCMKSPVAYWQPDPITAQETHGHCAQEGLLMRTTDRVVDVDNC